MLSCELYGWPWLGHSSIAMTLNTVANRYSESFLFLPVAAEGYTPVYSLSNYFGASEKWGNV